MMKQLTPSEEQVMLKLWRLNECTVAQMLDLYPDPKPAYNTVSTIVRILEDKKFIKHKKQGRGYLYLPKISKVEYREFLIQNLVQNYFDGSKSDAASHLMQQRSLTELLG